MKRNDGFIVLSFFLYYIIFMSCSNPLVDKANEENRRFMGADSLCYKVDADIHKYNITHNTTLLYNVLAYLDDIPINNDNRINWHTRRLTVLRLLHKYDSVYAFLDTCTYDAVGDFGIKKQLLITDISRYNFYHQFEKRDQKIDELIAYMEYCFERQIITAEKGESVYLQKYKDNQLALCAVATEMDPYTLNWYIGARLLRGDKTTDLELLIENYYQKGLIDEVGKDWLGALLDGNYEEKDFDKRL